MPGRPLPSARRKGEAMDLGPDSGQRMQVRIEQFCRVIRAGLSTDKRDDPNIPILNPLSPSSSCSVYFRPPTIRLASSGRWTIGHWTWRSHVGNAVHLHTHGFLSSAGTQAMRQLLFGLVPAGLWTCWSAALGGSRVDTWCSTSGKVSLVGTRSTEYRLMRNCGRHKDAASNVSQQTGDCGKHLK